MSEVNLFFQISYSNTDDASLASKKIRKLLNESHQDLNSALYKLEAFNDKNLENEITVESLQRTKSNINISAYSGRIDSPVWLIKSIALTGCEYISLREQWDDGGQTHYFIKDRKVSKKVYDEESYEGDIAGDTEGLYLPEGRVRIKAKLLESDWIDSDFGTICYMKFMSEDGHTIYYKGTSEKLALTALDDYEDNVEFDCSIERELVGSIFIARIKRPTNILVKEAEKEEFSPKSFRGKNRKFIDGPLGKLTLAYLNEYSCSSEKAIHSLSDHGIMGFTFTAIISKLKKIEEHNFSGFGINISLDDSKFKMVEINSAQDGLELDLESFNKKILAWNIEFFQQEIRENYSEISWANKGIDVNLVLRRNGFKFVLKKLPKTTSKNALQTYKWYSDHPGEAGLLHWKILFDEIKLLADSGDPECMTIIGHLYNSSVRSWDMDIKASEKYWKMAAELGNVDAMWALGRAYSWRTWPNDEETAIKYLKMGANLGHRQCAKELKKYNVLNE
ncbi:tetratricopeptide repeat protein [Microbulbifer sp. CNSA002]|uniref:tetratricopeptide repeat protein n=1 Tax=Microbulbifer sp. CNSA002 TaxID=3373604 RepID=UPI0039B451F4